jgi:hypothetical protein
MQKVKDEITVQNDLIGADLKQETIRCKVAGKNISLKQTLIGMLDVELLKDSNENNLSAVLELSAATSA